MTTRATILSRAFAKIGIADYQYAVTPAERADARACLDAMMAEWAASGRDLDYTPSDGTDNDGVAMTTPGWADSAIWNSLAIELADEFGKTVTPGTGKAAKRGYGLVTSKVMTIPAISNARSVTTGAGERYYRRYAY